MTIPRTALAMAICVIAALTCAGCGTSGDSASSKSENGALSGSWRTSSGATIAFDDLHRVLGNDGCNSFKGTWRTNAHRVSLDVSTSHHQCLAPATLVLEKSMTWKVTGRKLDLQAPKAHVTNHLTRG